MNEDIARLIRFPKELWDAIDADAQRCKRSTVRRMEAVLTAYYNLEDVELDRSRLEIIGELAPRSKKTLPLIEATVEPKKKRTA